MNLTEYTLLQLQEYRGTLRAEIRALENKAQFRTVSEEADLKSYRALFRRVYLEIKRRAVQPPLL